MACDTLPESADLPPGPEGLAVDLPCPTCQYNLRGLIIPRCPECGFAFAWKDVPRFQQEMADRATSRHNLRVFFLVGGLILLALSVFPEIVMGIFAMLLCFGLIAAVCLAVSGFQACIEIVVTRPVLRDTNPKFFRAWWEGVLIGYGLCAMTCLLLDRPAVLFDMFSHYADSALIAWLLLLTGVESLVTQWWVVHRRCRQWAMPIGSMRLLLACLLAKLVMAMPWVWIATGGLAS